MKSNLKYYHAGGCSIEFRGETKIGASLIRNQISDVIIENIGIEPEFGVEWEGE
jgi:hypothetical protein